jgi:hypothetical protein
MLESTYVQKPEELLAHPEYIQENNKWMHRFLTQLEINVQEGVV